MRQIEGVGGRLKLCGGGRGVVGWGNMDRRVNSCGGNFRHLAIPFLKSSKEVRALVVSGPILFGLG